jgi:BirA family biotin operon repressor/biotin-[acetyl-CoA-carboxylase] ligase
VFDVSRLCRSGLIGHVDFHATIGSTSDRALELAARDDVPLPLLVLAERQTGGRGRGTNRWWSSEGALTFSLVLDAAPLSADQRPRTAIVGGLAVCEALAELAPRGQWQVKWPNDVYASGRKACGILCESTPGWAEHLVVGIGINVNNSIPGRQTGGQQTGHTEQDALRGAVAMIDLDARARDLTEVLLAVLDRFDLRWSELVAGKFAELAAAYRQRCLLTGKTIAVHSGAERHVGICRGIDGRGALVLATESGPRTIVAGSVDWID